ncbi:MAG: pyrroline-5-carboxylate reductase [Caulobacteraceae bacterium]
MTTPILVLGAGRMGGALLQGWALKQAFAPHDLLIVDPHPSQAALAAAEAGARLNPPPAELADAATVLLAVKPQMWREAAAGIVPHLAADAVVVSVAAGVRAADLAEAFGGRAVARVMPITAVAVGQGAAAVFSADARARAAAHALLDPVAGVADLEDEDLMDAATAVCGSAPAYLYAFVEALEAAGEAEGLSPDAARTLARSTIVGAAALLAQSGEEPSELRRQVTSPGGTTEAALKVLMGERGLGPLMREAAAAAVHRSRELSKS